MAKGRVLFVADKAKEFLKKIKSQKPAFLRMVANNPFMKEALRAAARKELKRRGLK